MQRDVCLCFCMCECNCWERWGCAKRAGMAVGMLVLPEGLQQGLQQTLYRGKLSNQIHWEIKGYVCLNQAHRRSLAVSLLGKGNWFLTKVFYRSHHWWRITSETTENLDRVCLRQIVIPHPHNLQRFNVEFQQSMIDLLQGCILTLFWLPINLQVTLSVHQWIVWCVEPLNTISQSPRSLLEGSCFIKLTSPSP